MSIIGQQSQVLSVADAYRVLGTLALLLIPLALQMTRIPAPDPHTAASRASVPSPTHG
jgi:DHA2 family multidrug resistance protein